MKDSKKHVILGNIVIIILLCALSFAYAEIKIPKKDIPNDCPTDVKQQIEKFYSSSPIQRYEAINLIAKMDSRAILSIPWLIDLLNDNSLAIAQRGNTTWRINDEGVMVSACGFFRQPNDICIYVADAAANALKELSKQDFGRDSVKWLEWWNNNKDNLLKNR